MRFTAAVGVKKSTSDFRRFTAFASSSHVIGTEMKGPPSLARIAYTPTVVLKSEFWLQSISTFPRRSVFVISETTRSGICCVASSAIVLAKGCVIS